MKKLSLVVNCTNRKSVPASAETSARNLPAGSVATRVAEWSSRILSAPAGVTLNELYKGEGWQQVQKLHKDIADEGVQVDLFVVSAGLGLRSVREKAPSYAATFSSGQLDSVVSTPRESQQWWSGLNSQSRLSAIGAGPVLFVLSETYARAIHEDLEVFGQRRRSDCLLVGGWRDIAGVDRVPADRALRASLGGTVSSLNLRMARSWWAQRKTSSLVGPDDHASWTKWRRATRIVESWERRVASDEEILKLATELKRSDPTMSASRALRAVRDAGVACEQKRFRHLFLPAGVQ